MKYQSGSETSSYFTSVNCFYWFICVRSWWSQAWPCEQTAAPRRPDLGLRGLGEAEAVEKQRRLRRAQPSEALAVHLTDY